MRNTEFSTRVGGRELPELTAAFDTCDSRAGAMVSVLA